MLWKFLSLLLFPEPEWGIKEEELVSEVGNIKETSGGVKDGIK